MSKIKITPTGEIEANYKSVSRIWMSGYYSNDNHRHAVLELNIIFRDGTRERIESTIIPNKNNIVDEMINMAKKIIEQHEVEN